MLSQDDRWARMLDHTKKLAKLYECNVLCQEFSFNPFRITINQKSLGFGKAKLFLHLNASHCKRRVRYLNDNVVECITQYYNNYYQLIGSTLECVQVSDFLYEQCRKGRYCLFDFD